MHRILIVYSTTDGHTQNICRYLKGRMSSDDVEVVMVSVHTVGRENIEWSDTVVIGASIRYGKHHPDVYLLLKQYRHLLLKKTHAFFSVNLVARKPNKNTPETNPYVVKFLTDVDWRPDLCGVFAGRLVFEKYNIVNRFFLRLIISLSEGKLVPARNVEYTNWRDIDAFAHSLILSTNCGNGV